MTFHDLYIPWADHRAFTLLTKVEASVRHESSMSRYDRQTQCSIYAGQFYSTPSGRYWALAQSQGQGAGSTHEHQELFQNENSRSY